MQFSLFSRWFRHSTEPGICGKTVSTFGFLPLPHRHTTLFQYETHDLWFSLQVCRRGVIHLKSVPHIATCAAQSPGWSPHKAENRFMRWLWHGSQADADWPEELIAWATKNWFYVASSTALWSNGPGPAEPAQSGLIRFETWPIFKKHVS